MVRDERVDSYIERQADFARPILQHLRGLVHSGCDAVEETLKWGMPAFVYKGEILATMAAFKAHAAFGFWRGDDIVDEGEAKDGAMGQFGRITSLDDLPEPAALRKLVRKAAALVDANVKAPRITTKKAPLEVPEDFAAALKEKMAASANFAAFSPSSQREYIEWVMDAKRPETRTRRIAEAVGWIAEGKKRNWKYEKC